MNSLRVADKMEIRISGRVTKYLYSRHGKALSHKHGLYFKLCNVWNVWNVSMEDIRFKLFCILLLYTLAFQFLTDLQKHVCFLF